MICRCYLAYFYVYQTDQNYTDTVSLTPLCVQNMDDVTIAQSPSKVRGPVFIGANFRPDAETMVP